MTQTYLRWLAGAAAFGLMLTLLATFPQAQEPKTEKAQEGQAEAKGAPQAGLTEAFSRRLQTDQFIRLFDSLGSGVDLVKELQITAEQKAKLDATMTRHRAEASSAMGARGARLGRGEPGFEAQLKARMEAREATSDRTAKEIKAALTKEQLERLDQIDLQERLRSSGMARGLTATLGQKLKITPEQEAKLREAENKAQEQFLLEMENLRLLQLNSLEEARRRVVAVLTPEQRAEYEKLVGTPLSPDQRALEYGVAGVSARFNTEGGFRGRGGFGTYPTPAGDGDFSVPPQRGRGGAGSPPPAAPLPAGDKP